MSENQKLDLILQKITDMSTDISDLKSDVSEMKIDITNLKFDVSEMKVDIINLKSDVSEMKADIINLKSDVSEMKADITNLKSDVSEMKADIINLKSNLVKVHEKINKHYNMFEEFYVYQQEFNTNVSDYFLVINGTLEMYKNQISRNTALLQMAVG